MTRTALSPKLSQHRREPLLEIHPDDAAALGIRDYGFARLGTPYGEALFRARLSEGQRRGELFVPMHWTDRMSSGGRSNRLPGPQHDPHSGQPGFKNSKAQAEPWTPDWRGFLVLRERPETLPEGIYWTAARQEGGWLIELAGIGTIDIDALLPAGERIEAQDAARGSRRIVVRASDGGLAAALFFTRSGTLPPRDWIIGLLADAADHSASALLAGRPAEAQPDKGPLVCVCFSVGENDLRDAIAGQSLCSVEAVGKATQAGTNCGSCRPAIAKLLAEVATAAV
jgi:assimilatory nitrate reductase catalytic subunit